MVDVWDGAAATGARAMEGTTVGMTVDETWTEELLSVTVMKPVLYSVMCVVEVEVAFAG